MNSATLPASISPHEFSADALKVHVYADEPALALAAANIAATHLQTTLARQGSAAMILASGNSQLRFLEKLFLCPDLDWSAVTCFHMDEYLGVTADHPASFRRYMREHVERRVKPKAFHYLAGDALEPLSECERYTGLLRAQPIDFCCLGLGENGHLAFNDPDVADFADPHGVKIVKLDLRCRQQQVNQGHFAGLENVPQYALTLTIPTLLSARKVLCLAPEKRKAVPVRDLLQGPVATKGPASILRRQAHATLLLDEASASLL